MSLSTLEGEEECCRDSEEERERENLLQYTRAGSRGQRKTSFSFFDGKWGVRKRNGWSLFDIWHLQRSAPHILYADRSVLIKWFDIRRIIWTSLPMGRSARGDHRLECWSSNRVLIVEVAKRVRYAAHRSKYKELRSTNRCHGMSFKTWSTVSFAGPQSFTLMAKQWQVNFFGNWTEVETLVSFSHRYLVLLLSLSFNSRVLLMYSCMYFFWECVLLCRLISMRSISKLFIEFISTSPTIIHTRQLGFLTGIWLVTAKYLGH